MRESSAYDHVHYRRVRRHRSRSSFWTFGIGGGTIMVPLFRLAFGLDPIQATATSLFTIIPTSVSGLVKHARNKTSLPRVGLLCGLAGACLSPVGVWAATKSPGWAIMGATALVIAYSSITMFRKALAAPKRENGGEERIPETQGRQESLPPSGLRLRIARRSRKSVLLPVF
ncbi:MAG: sulfite exporter TauE/SafE family protein [Slackia sp.]